MSTHSGQGEPPQPPSASTPREGVVLPSGGAATPAEEVRPGQAQVTSGQPWGQPWGPDSTVAPPPTQTPSAPQSGPPQSAPVQHGVPLPPETPASPPSGYPGYPGPAGPPPAPPHQPPAGHQPPPAPPQPPSAPPPSVQPPLEGQVLPRDGAQPPAGSFLPDLPSERSASAPLPPAAPGYDAGAGYSQVPSQPYGSDQPQFSDGGYASGPPADSGPALPPPGAASGYSGAPQQPYQQPYSHQQQFPQQQQQQQQQQQPAGDAEATQLIPSFSQQAGPGEDVEATTMLRRLTLPPESAGQPPPGASGAAETTQLLPPIAGGNPGQHPGGGSSGPQPGGTPFDVRPGVPGDRQPLAEFDGLFRADAQSGPGADGTQQLPLFAQAADSQQGGYQQGGYQQGGYQQGSYQQRGYQPEYDDEYDGPDSHGRSDRRSGGVSRNAVIGIVVACCAVAGLVAGALLSGGGEDEQPQGGGSPSTKPAVNSASASPDPDAGLAKAQATELSKLLGESNNSRATVINSVRNIKVCKKLDAAAKDLRSAAKQRNTLVTKLDQLTLTALPSHQELSTALTKAWKASAKADNHYAAWADQVAAKKGCTKGQARTTNQLSSANAASGEATKAKQQAAKLWNPTARKHDLPERQVIEL